MTRETDASSQALARCRRVVDLGEVHGLCRVGCVRGCGGLVRILDAEGALEDALAWDLRVHKASERARERVRRCVGRTRLRALAAGLSFSPGAMLYALRLRAAFEEDAAVPWLRTAMDRRRLGEILAGITCSINATHGVMQPSGSHNPSLDECIAEEDGGLQAQSGTDEEQEDDHDDDSGSDDDNVAAGQASDAQPDASRDWSGTMRPQSDLT